MRCAIHQCNFTPWLPFFYKMAISDKFIILTQCQFEKNGFQNRYQTIDGSWVTMPVKKGNVPIAEKMYTNGISLLEHNVDLIKWIADTLDIRTHIVRDCYSSNTGTKRLLDNLNCHGASTYITNPDSKDKYLEENIIRECGIEIEYCKVPNDLKIPIWFAFETIGISNLRKRLKKERELALVRAMK